ncbi:MAG: Rqc2 family fibronectin-binding protein [Christensenellales bacterium]|jgi:predicted ribosome quality control (RQC) complex YloA/Tae2 family protein
MPLDGIALRAIATELNHLLLGGRVEKVLQPERDELVLQIKSQQGGYRLLLSASSNHARVHITQKNKPNPAAPPVFCMLMRKHLTGGRIERIEQLGMERVLKIDISGFDEMGDPLVRSVMVEIMGRHSNVVVCANGRIIDSLKRVPEQISRVREVLPGLPYQLPPAQDKRDGSTLREMDFLELLQGAPALRLDKYLCDSLTGVSPVSAREMAVRALGDYQRLASDLTGPERIAAARAMYAFFEPVRAGVFAPQLVTDGEGGASDVLPFPYALYDAGRLSPMDTMGQALDAYYDARDSQEHMRQKSASLKHLLTNNLERCQRKEALQQQAVLDAQGAEEYRLKGELITAHVYALQKGLTKAQLDNYYDPEGGRITVDLDPQLSPSDNAQRYYKRYNKAKSAARMAQQQLEKTHEEMTYLEGQLDNLDKCTTEAELSEMRRELAAQGYVKRVALKKEPRKAPPTKPMRFVSDDGLEILVGKNNTQNDQLTLRTAAPDDLWLHVKNSPGSHVIVRCGGQPVPEASLRQALLLAAWFSRARGSANVAVDYCPRRQVKKPAGAKPGFVIYEKHRTGVITPEASLVRAIRQVE